MGQRFASFSERSAGLQGLAVLRHFFSPSSVESPIPTKQRCRAYGAELAGDCVRCFAMGYLLAHLRNLDPPETHRTLQIRYLRNMCLGPKRRTVLGSVPSLFVVLGLSWCSQSRADHRDVSSSETPRPNPQQDRLVVKLPPPRQTSRISLEDAIQRRRSVREFSDAPLSEPEYGQLLWATQGITHRTMGLRAAPSAGALYPLELYLATSEGVFHYEPRAHAIQRTLSTDIRVLLFDAALRQEAVRDAPAVFVVTGVYARTAKKYGRRASRYVHLEAGHAAQNLLLQAVALGLVAVPIGAFDDDAVERALALPPTHRPLYLVPVGHPQ
jgi:SagB-type dehydrogenase family enzyme